MMRKTLSILILGLLLVLAIIPPAPAAGRERNSKRVKLEERLTTLRNWQLMEQFDLGPEKATKVFTILKNFDDQRVELIQKRRRLLQQLRKAVETTGAGDETKTETTLNSLMKQLSQTSVALARIPEKERRGLAEVFTPLEQARYILFVNDFSREMRRVIKKKRPGRRDRRPRQHY